MTGEKLKVFGCKKVLVIFEKVIKTVGIVDKVLDSIKAAGIETVLYDKVVPNPPDYLLNEAGALAVTEKVDGIVAIGGGSSIDTGKGARILTSYPAPINQYFARVDSAPLSEGIMKPLVVILTTAGTSSEASPSGVIVDTSTREKAVLTVSASLGILDLELMTGWPPQITVNTGIDALCHAVELVTSKLSNKFGVAVGKKAITLISKYLPIVCKDDSNIEAREGIRLAATMASMSMRGPFSGIPHDLGSPLSKVYPADHGTAAAGLLAETLKFIAPASPDKVKLVAECLGAKIPANASPEDIGDIARDTVRKLYAKVKLPGMKTFIKSKEDLLANIDKFFKGSPFSPRVLGKLDAIVLLSASYDAS